MKLIPSIFIAVICFLSLSAHAEGKIANEEKLNNADSIFNWVESKYGNYFPSSNEEPSLSYRTISTLSGWVYRDYPKIGNAIGVYNDDIYVTGTSWSASANSPIRVMSVNEALVLIEEDKINGVDENIISVKNLISYNYVLGDAIDFFGSNGSVMKRKRESYFPGYELAKQYLRISLSSRVAWKKSRLERNHTDSSTIYGQKLRNAEHYLFTYSEIERFGYTHIAILTMLVDGYCGLSGGYEIFSYLRHYFNSYNRMVGSVDAAKAGCFGALHSARRVYWENN